MDRILAWKARFGQLLHRSAAESRMDEEMRFHLEMETEKKIEEGLPPAEARRQARLAFGGVETHRESMRDHRKLPLEDLARDGVLAIRSLFRSRSFAIVSIMTIGVAIGATTAIFSVVDAVLLRPLPYPDADELVTVRLEVGIGSTDDLAFSDRAFWHFHEHNRSFERFGGFATTQQPLVGDGEPVQVDVAAMTIDAFEAIGVAPLRGRFPTAEEDIPTDRTSL